jgi:hypothetical protein
VKAKPPQVSADRLDNDIAAAAARTLLGLTAQHEPSTYRTITQRAA